MKIILASGSPRRKEILETMNLEFDVIKSETEESIKETEKPYELVERLSYEKAMDVAKNNRDALVIGADTVVSIGNMILGKPSDDNDAFKMISMLSGKEHDVTTGVSMINLSENKKYVMHCVSKVKFRELTEDDIWDYISTGEHTDKAGSYGIQGFGALLVEYIKGDYFNIVGFPISDVGKILKENFGINLFTGRGESE